MHSFFGHRSNQDIKASGRKRALDSSLWAEAMLEVLEEKQKYELMDYGLICPPQKILVAPKN